MAPVLSGLSSYEEEAVIKCLSPRIRVDMMTSSAAVKNGENFMSVVTRVCVHGHDLDTGDKVTLSLIMKRPPESAERRELFLCDAAFQNEAVFYSEVVPMLALTPKSPFPQSLLAIDDVIILRDLRQDGFTMADRKTGLDLDHCFLVMRELGKFHAKSYEMKKTMPEAFLRIRSLVKEVFITEENLILSACVDNAINMALMVTERPELAVIATLKSILGRGVEVLTPHVLPQEPVAVICHGDLWINNILFSCPEDRRDSIELCFLDLQGWRYASSSLDILYFLFTSGVPSSHFLQQISAYHEAIGDHVSMNELMAEVRKHAIFGLVMSLIVLPIITADDVNVNLDDVTQDNILEFQEKLEEGVLNARYSKRVNNMIDLVTQHELF